MFGEVVRSKLVANIPTFFFSLSFSSLLCWGISTSLRALRGSGALLLDYLTGLGDS